MKTTIKILIFLAVMLIISCNDTNDMLTVINADGSCYREFTAKVNRNFILGDSVSKNNPFPIEIDSACQIRWRYRNSKWYSNYPADRILTDSVMRNTKFRNKESQGIDRSTDFEVIIRIYFKSVQDLAEKFSLKESHEWSKMKVKYSLEKKFRWFYTYYHFRETYPKLVTNFEIPIENYISKDEALFWFTGQPNVLKGMNGLEIREYVGKIEDNFNKWYAQNLWNNEYKCLLSNYGQIKNKPVNIKQLAILKDSIFKSVKDYEKIEMKDVLNNYFKTNAFDVLWKDENSQMNKFEKSLDEQEYITYFTKQFNYKLVMPGKVTPPENVVIQGDTLVWNLTAYRTIPSDYTIEAKSRKTNLWAFILTGFILIIAVGSFVWKPGRK